MWRYVLILSSFSLYGVAFLAPRCFWWGALLFAAPLFYRVTKGKITVLDGMFWCAGAFLVHVFAIFEGFFAIPEIHILPKTLLIILFMGIFFTYAAIFFFLASLKNYLVSFMVLFWLFFIFLEHGALFFLGRVEGYLLCNPLVPLVECPGFLYFLPKIGSVGLLLLLLTTQATLVYALVYGRWWRVFFFACISFWAFSVITWHMQVKKNIDIQHIVIATIKIPAHDSIKYTAQELRDCCKMILKKIPETEIILFPESACECPLVCGEKDYIALCGKNHIGKAVTLLVGGFRWDNTQYRNTVYWIHDGKVIDIFDKRHAMAVTERTANSYFKNFPDIVPSCAVRPVWQINENLALVPYICSELFFNHTQDHTSRDSEIIVACCNDRWVLRDYMRYLMSLGARFRAIQWQTPIVYAAYHYQMLCEPSGEFTFYQVSRLQEVASRD